MIFNLQNPKCEHMVLLIAISFKHDLLSAGRCPPGVNYRRLPAVAMFTQKTKSQRPGP